MVPYCITNYLDQTLNSSECAQAWRDLPTHSQREQEVKLSKIAKSLFKPKKSLGYPGSCIHLDLLKTVLEGKKSTYNLEPWSPALKIQLKLYKRLQNKVFIAKNGPRVIPQQQQQPGEEQARPDTEPGAALAMPCHLSAVRAFNAGYLQISLPLVSQPPFPTLKVLFCTRTCKLSDSFLPHWAIFNQCDTNSEGWDKYKTYFLNTQNWFLQAIFYTSCQHLNATKAFSMSKQCHLEKSIYFVSTSSRPSCFFVNVLGNKF